MNILILLSLLISCNNQFKLNSKEKMLKLKMTFTPITLFLASQNGDFEYLRECLKNNVEDNYIDYNNSSSLIIAANEGIIGQPTKFEKSEDYSKIVDLLIKYNVNIDAVNNFNNNALTYAIAKKNKRTINILLSAGAILKVDPEINKEEHISFLTDVLIELFNSIHKETIDKILENIYEKLNTELFNLLISNQELKEKTLEMINLFSEDKKRQIKEKLFSNEKVKELFSKTKLLDSETGTKESITRMSKILSE